MKKNSLLLFILITLMWSCNGINVKKEEDTSTLVKKKEAAIQTNTPPIKVYKSLNGIEEGVDTTMINYFRDHKNEDKNPLPKSIWFRKEIVTEIVKVFNTDAKLDGLRIYFGAEPTTGGHLKLSIILVATKEDGIDNVTLPYQSAKKHKDFYLDQSLYSLYNLKSIQGDICDGIGCKGTLLYRPGAGGVGGIGCRALPHDVSVSYAENMVGHFRLSHTINTNSEWFDRALFDVIDSDKLNNNYTGIRIYLGRHPSSSNIYYSDRDAFLITTTTGKDTTDVFDCKISKSYVNLYNKHYPDNKHQFNIARFTPAKDNGEICPNHCN